ncbi:DUF262 domain-containing protein [Stenotrophomonas sp. Marseille-Q5258]|uniref:DUF262 domain-containing protein n=1 Tax=Stenotrophomonas sp. Marseille-Q5258 TaxID=2972779 RepID=UPI0021CA5663|nr:DUF262 domain-containing protein [Stenotrophomonas sp. Marseille-Q5258]
MSDEFVASDDLEDGVDAPEEESQYKFDLTFYGADYPVDGLVKRLKRGDIVVPSFDPVNEAAFDVEAFQRKFVWSKLQCDRFIESLLLGLPVPGIFLVQQSNKALLVLDGQQRLLTLSAFYSGILNKKEFVLEHVQPQFKGLTYDKLKDDERRVIDDSLIHATVIKKTSEEQDLSSIYSLFERLNSGGTQLSPHEIRVALAPGRLMNLVRDLNANVKWREIFGPMSKKLKDHELILRFLALRYWADSYKSPMKDFLTKFAQKYAALDESTAADFTKSFSDAIGVAHEVAGKRAFKLTNALNAAVFDSVMAGIASRLDAGGSPPSIGALQEAYEALLLDPEYIASVSKATAREGQVEERVRLAVAAFGGV